MTICYVLGDELYINLTNRCTNRCSFCVRDTDCGISDDVDLWIDREPTAEEVIADIKKFDPSKYREVVFCGYGEPMIRIDELLAAAKFIKENYNIPIRINTNGHANRIHGRDVTPELKGLIDTVSISLNAKDREQYRKLCHCDFGAEGYDEMIEFTKKCKKVIPHVILSVVDVIPKADIEECRKTAESLGVVFRVREMIQ